MEEKKLTCICCPMGCQLQVTIRDGQVEKVEGNTCKRGAEYGKKEVTNPTRIVTTTVRVHGGSLPGGTGKDSFRYSEECSDGLHPTVKRSGCRGSGVHRGCGADRSCRNKNRGNNY